MAVLINDNGMLGLRESYSPINTNFSNHGELFVLTNWLEERLKYTMFSADIIGKKMTFQYLEGREFAIVDKKNGLGFFPPFTMVRVVFPLDEFAKLKSKLLSQPNIDRASLECVGLIDYITQGVEDTILYIEVEK